MSCDEPAPSPRPGPPPPGRSATVHPTALKVAGFLCAAACLGFAVVSGLTLYNTLGSLQRASAYTDQQIRAQTIYTSLLRADASRNASQLRAGPENSQDRAVYDEALGDATVKIAEGAAAEPSDSDYFAQLNGAVVEYASLVEHGRTETRRGNVVGTQYQRVASERLRDALPLLLAVGEANHQRIEQEIGWAPRQLVVLAVVAVATLTVHAVVAVLMARRFRRRVNLGLAVAAVLLLVGALLGLGLQALTVAKLRTYGQGTGVQITALTQARVAAYDARALEGLTLAAHGSGSAYEAQWRTRSDEARRSLDTAGLPTDDLDAYVVAHRQVRNLDDGGDWTMARDYALNETASAFDRFDQQLATHLELAQQRRGLELAPPPGLTLAIGVVPLFGLAAMAAAILGVVQRLVQYPGQRRGIGR